MKKMVVLFVWTFCCFVVGYSAGKNSAQNAEMKKDVQLYQKREKTTTAQEKTAEKIKIIYRELKTHEKDCDFVLDFNVSKCLPK